MRLLKQQNLISGPNLLLAAAKSANLEVVQQLLYEGRTPSEMVPMEPIRPFDSDMKEMTTIPPSQATNGGESVCVLRSGDPRSLFDENRDSPGLDVVNPPSEDSHVASSERTLDSQALTTSCTLCYVR